MAASITITKGRLLELALASLGISTSLLDITAEETGLALNAINAVLSEPIYESIPTGYVPDADALAPNVTDILTIPSYALNGLTASVVISVAPIFNVEPKQVHYRAAQHGRTLMYRNNTLPLTAKTFPRSMPLGLGNRIWGTFIGDVQ
jgi:P22 tail accessory factor